MRLEARLDIALPWGKGCVGRLAPLEINPSDEDRGRAGVDDRDRCGGALEFGGGRGGILAGTRSRGRGRCSAEGQSPQQQQQYALRHSARLAMMSNDAS